MLGSPYDSGVIRVRPRRRRQALALVTAPSRDPGSRLGRSRRRIPAAAHTAAASTAAGLSDHRFRARLSRREGRFSFSPAPLQP